MPASQDTSQIALLHRCIGCQTTFRTSASLRSHEGKCDAYKNFNTRTVQLRRKRRRSSLEPAPQKRQRMETDPVASNLEEVTQSLDIPLPALNSWATPEPEPATEAAPIPSLDPVPEPPPVTITRSSRAVRFPKKYIDYIPSKQTAAASARAREMPDGRPISDSITSRAAPSDPSPTSTIFETKPNAYGLFKRFPRMPTHDPDREFDLLRVSDPTDFPSASRPTVVPASRPSEDKASMSHAPFSNWSAATLFTWRHTKSVNKSASEAERLAHVLGSAPNREDDPAQVLKDLSSYNDNTEKANLDAYMASPTTHFSEQNGWKRSKVSIPLPCDGTKRAEKDAFTLDIDGIYHQDLCDLIYSRYSTSPHFHYTPFLHFVRLAPDQPPQRVRSNIFLSPAMMQADKEVQALELPEDLPQRDLERVVAPLIEASDATHLAQFGDASLWPGYQMYGAEDQYIHCSPNQGSCDHTVYIPKLPDDFQERYFEVHGKHTTKDMVSFLKRELTSGNGPPA